MVDLKFLKLLQHLEAKMKALYRTIHVKDGENVEQTVFNKIISNKDSVVKSAVNATKLLKSSHGMLKSAAAHLDSLKCEHLQNQSNPSDSTDKLYQVIKLPSYSNSRCSVK